MSACMVFSRGSQRAHGREGFCLGGGRGRFRETALPDCERAIPAGSCSLMVADGLLPKMLFLYA
jgi:hypothetical protein